MKRALTAAAAAVAFVALVVASNWLTATYGLVWGLVTAGTFTAAAVLAVRDLVRETGGLWLALTCIAAGAALSLLMAPPRLAAASAVAFFVAELADTLVYEPLRRSGRLRAAAWSNALGSVVDTVLFLAIAGFPLWPAAASQTVVKWAVCVLPLAIWGAGEVLRDRLRTEGA